MSLIPISPIWALLHLCIKYPPIIPVAAIGYFGYPMVMEEVSGPDRVVQDLTGKPMVALTFDDGWESVLTLALPELQSRGMVATNYISTGFYGYEGYINRDDVPTFVNAGWELGAHSIDHPNMATMTRDEIIAQLKVPLEDLSEFAPVTAFSTPFGSYTDEVIDLAQTYYSTHVNAKGGDNNAAWGFNFPAIFDPMNINRLDTNEVEVWKICQAVTSLQDEMYVMIFHKLDFGPSKDYSINFYEFQQILDCIEASGAAVVTISEGATELQSRNPAPELAMK